MTLSILIPLNVMSSLIKSDIIKDPFDGSKPFKAVSDHSVAVENLKMVACAPGPDHLTQTELGKHCASPPDSFIACCHDLNRS